MRRVWRNIVLYEASYTLLTVVPLLILGEGEKALVCGLVVLLAGVPGVGFLTAVLIPLNLFPIPEGSISSLVLLATYLASMVTQSIALVTLIGGD